MPFKQVAIFTFAVISCLPFNAFAQGRSALYIDSLLKILPALPEDTAKVEVLCKISFAYYDVDMQAGFRHGNEALALAEKIGWQKGIAKAYAGIGSNYWASGDFAKAQEHYLKSLRIEETTGDKSAIAKSLHRVGVSYSSQHNKRKAITYFERALQLFQQTGDTASAMGCYLNIGEQYEDMEDFARAIENYTSARQLAGAGNRKRDLAFILNMIGRAYAGHKDYAQAFDYVEKSVEQYRAIEVNNELASQYGNAGDVYFMAGDYKQCLNAYRNAIKIYKPVKERSQTSYYGSWYGQTGKVQLALYKQTKRVAFIDEAIKHLEKSIVICESAIAWNFSEDFHRTLSEAYSLKGDHAQAFTHLKIADQYRDSLVNTQQYNKLLTLELEYEYNKRKDSLDYEASLKNIQLQNEKKMHALALRTQWLYSLIVIVILGLIASYFFFYYRVKQLRLNNELQREKTEKELKETAYQKQINDITFSALRAQMNPHFIFNALNTIQHYVYSNDKKSATNYLGKFSELIRNILDNSNKEQISLTEEIDLLRLYIDIEKARFGDSFHGIIEVDPTLDTDGILIPPMLIQPYAENAIKHGLLHLPGEKKLLIRINTSANGRFAEIIIDDNGIGREQSMEINRYRIGHQAFANTANAKRIDLLNLSNPGKITLEITDKKNADDKATGTTVIISVLLDPGKKK